MPSPIDDAGLAAQIGRIRKTEAIVFSGGSWTAPDYPWRGLVAATAGIVMCRCEDDPSVDRALPIAAGVPVTYAVKRITEAGTTATGLVRFL